MKKTTKLISVFLAVLMLALAIPFSAVAKTLMTTTADDSKLLLSLDNLGATPVAGKADADGTVTLGEAKMGANEVTSEGYALTVTKKERTYYSYVRATEYDLTGTEKYTITYTATLPECDADLTDNLGSDYEWTRIGFAFNMNPDADATKAGDALTLWKFNNVTSPILRLSKTNLAHNGKVCDDVANTDDFTGTHDYAISIDGKNIAFYMGGKYLGTLGGDAISYISNGKLALGMRIHADTANIDATPFTLYSMSNIKVYNDTYDNILTTSVNCDNSEPLLKLKTPFTTTLTDDIYNGSEYEDVTVTQNPNNNVFKADGTNLNNVTNGMTGDDTVYAKKLEAFSGKTYWFEGGATTNLPLDVNSKYTVEFYMKRHVEALNLGFIFDYVGKNRTNQGIYFYENSIATISGTSTKVYNVADTADKSLSCKNLWNAYQSADGYTRFAIEVNGTKITVFVGGKQIGAFDFGDGFNGSSLALAVKGYVTNTEKVELGSALVSIKDVTVYSGNIESACNIRFESESGALLNAVIKDPNSVLTATDFPSVEASEGQIVKWFYKNTNIIVNAPYEATHDTTLVARVIDLNEIRVAGMQYTDMDEATKQQSVRFISTLHSLQGTEAGFNVKAYYKDAEGNVVKHDKEWNIESTVVYSTIKATSASGTVSDVTAEELGGTYLIAIAINKVPATYEQIDFYVESYVVVNGETITSEEVRFTMSNGESAELPALEIPQA